MGIFKKLFKRNAVKNHEFEKVEFDKLIIGSSTSGKTNFFKSKEELRNDLSEILKQKKDTNKRNRDRDDYASTSNTPLSDFPTSYSTISSCSDSGSASNSDSGSSSCD